MIYGVDYDTTIFMQAVISLFYKSFMLILPSLLIALVVAVIVGIIMAAMQIQEQALSFLPKLFAMIFGFFFLGELMFSQLSEVVREFIISSLSML